MLKLPIVCVAPLPPDCAGEPEISGVAADDAGDTVPSALVVMNVALFSWSTSVIAMLLDPS